MMDNTRVAAEYYQSSKLSQFWMLAYITSILNPMYFF